MLLPGISLIIDLKTGTKLKMGDYNIHTPEGLHKWQRAVRKTASYAYTSNFLRTVYRLDIIEFNDRHHIITHDIKALEQNLC
jgi:hypothetical protein